MPHSSGGGSSSSGSHSSSSSSHSSSSHSSSSHSSSSSYGGGSSGPSYRVRDHHFNGATRFVYYRDHRPHYVYSDTDLRSEPNSKIQAFRYLFILFYIPFIAFAIKMWTWAFDEPVKPLTYTSSYNCIIQDNADVLSASEETELQKALDDFFETTGVPVAFYTDVNSTWKENYTSLENYAFDLYCDNFSDEYHWVIIYTESREGDSDHPSWYWEGIQGDYIDDVMNAFISAFNQKVQSSLNASKTVCQTFTDAFDTAIRKFNSQTVHVNSMIWPAIGITAFICIHCYFIVFFGNTKPKYKNSELVQVSGGVDLPPTETCTNCGGVYVANQHEKCPHCGAEIKYQSNDAENTLFQ